MARPNLWSKSVPRVDLDHRARDARVRLVRVERLLVPHALVAGFWLSPFVRLLGSRKGGNGRSGGRGGGSQSNSRLGCMPDIDAVWFEGCGARCASRRALCNISGVGVRALHFGLPSSAGWSRRLNLHFLCHPRRNLSTNLVKQFGAVEETLKHHLFVNKCDEGTGASNYGSRSIRRGSFSSNDRGLV
jgi:hypothetical protein